MEINDHTYYSERDFLDMISAKQLIQYIKCTRKNKSYRYSGKNKLQLFRVAIKCYQSHYFNHTFDDFVNHFFETILRA